MKIRYGRYDGRELGFVVSLAVVGLLLVTAVAFVPWYSAMTVAGRG
jgi:hypothetical protein